MDNAISEWQGSNRDHTEMVFGTQGDLQVVFSITSGEDSDFVNASAPGVTVAAVIYQGKLSAMKDSLDEGREYLAAVKR